MNTKSIAVFAVFLLSARKSLAGEHEAHEGVSQCGPGNCVSFFVIFVSFVVRM
jgi:hypothetical protein